MQKHIKKDFNKAMIQKIEEHTGEDILGQIAGLEMRSFFPKGFLRKFFMIIILLVGIYGIINISRYFIFIFLFGILFSPRIVGEIANALGTIVYKTNKIKGK